MPVVFAPIFRLPIILRHAFHSSPSTRETEQGIFAFLYFMKHIQICSYQMIVPGHLKYWCFQCANIFVNSLQAEF
jgi:hypothetical protein